MALKNLFDMVKADRYTADGREAIIKAQKAETEDATRRTYQIGEISQATGLQKTANGWVKPKNGKQPGAASKHDTDPQTYIVKKNDELRKMYLNEKDPAKKEAMKKALKKQASMMEPEPFSSTESKPDESARIAASKEARAKKSQELGQKAAGDFAKYKDLPPVQRKDALGAASHEGISIGLTQRSMEGMGWDLIQADDKVNVYGKPDGSKAIMKHDGKKITEVSYEGPENKPAVESIGRDEKLNKVRQVLNTALTPSGDKVQMTKSKVTGDFHVLLNGKSTGGGFRDPQKAKEEFNAWIAGKKAPSESAKERINKRFDESEARSQKAMEAAGNSLPDIPDFKGMESGDYDNKLRAEGWTTGGWEGNGTHASAIFKKGDRTIRVNEGQPGKITSVEEINKPAENTTTIRQGPNTKTLNETPAEHIQKNLDAYKGYSDYDMEELVLEPSGYKRSTGENLRGGREVITYTKNGSKDISLYFDKNGELEDVYIARGEPFDSAPRQLTGDTRIRVRKA